MSDKTKTVVISGISKGIGRATAIRMAEEGYAIAGFSRNKSDVKALEEELISKYKVSTLLRSVDISSKEQVENFGKEFREHFDQLDVLVNNAGFFIPGSISEEEEGVLEATLETNVYGTYYLTRELLPIMKEQKAGHIFNMCSTASITAYPNGGSYCISKFALLGFSKVLREELKEQGIKVTSILPGPTFTSSWEGAGIPEDRFMKADDIAQIIIHALSLSKSAVMEEILMRPQLGDI